MAKTRKKIAEQILRMVSGGNVSDDSSIDIREVMALVDQERDALIKAEIMGTGDFEVRGELLSKERLYTTDNSYVSLKNIPIGLPNDMGIFKVESVIPEDLKRNKRKLTITAGVPIISNTEEYQKLAFNKAPRMLDNQYRVSFTINIEDTTASNYWRATAKSHKFNFNVKMPEGKSFSEGKPRELSRFNTHNFVEAIANNQEIKDALRSINMRIRLTNNGTGARIDLGFAANYEFSYEDFKINGEDSGGSHLFEYAIEGISIPEASDYSESEQPPNEDNLTVNIGGQLFAVHYGSWSNRTVSAEDVARNFMDKHAQDLALKTGVSVTRDGAVLTFEEITPEGGRNLQNLTTGHYGDNIATTLENVGSSTEEADMSALFYNPISFTRMPSGGHTSSLYNETIIKSTLFFTFITGNIFFTKTNTDFSNIFKGISTIRNIVLMNNIFIYMVYSIRSLMFHLFCNMRQFIWC